jgi:hypothetical protein
VKVQDNRGRWMNQVDACVNGITGHRWSASAFERVAVLVDEDQPARGHPLEMRSLRVDQEAFVRKHH